MNTSVRTEDLDIDLSRFDRSTATPPAPPASRPSNFEDIPDGTYEARIEDAQLYVSPRSGNPVLKYTLRILGPSFANRVVWKYRAITEKTRDYVEDELRLCGLSLDRFSDLKYHLHDLIGVELEIVRRTRGEDINIYFKNLLDSGKKHTLADDDLPF
jgi:hypothetical protein